jgi:hypothetical protein
MLRKELGIFLRQDISDRFLKIVKQLRETQKPGRIFNLSRDPNKDELIFLIHSYEKEVGLVRFNQTKEWKIIEGINSHRVQIPIKIDMKSDISTHSHPLAVAGLRTLPSPDDIININPEAKNIIFDGNGLTFYSGIKRHPKTGLPWIPQSVKELKQSLEVRYVETKEYFAFLDPDGAEKAYKRMGIEIIRKSWKELPNNPLSGFSLI